MPTKTIHLINEYYILIEDISIELYRGTQKKPIMYFNRYEHTFAFDEANSIEGRIVYYFIQHCKHAKN